MGEKRWRRWMFLLTACMAAVISGGCRTADNSSAEAQGSSVTAEATPAEEQDATETPEPTEGSDATETPEPAEGSDTAAAPNPTEEPAATETPEPAVTLTSEPTPELTPAGEAAAAVDIKDYLESYEQLPELLGMERGEAWQFSGDDSYVKDGFALEWLDGYGIFSAKNESPSEVLLYGAGIGDPVSAAQEGLVQSGWVLYSDLGEQYTYIAVFNDQNFYLHISADADGCITDWYLNNWPEGEFVAEAYDGLRNQ